MSGEERTFIDGHLSLHHVDIFERQVFCHFIFSISRLSSQRDIRYIIRAQEEIDGEKESFALNRSPEISYVLVRVVFSRQ